MTARYPLSAFARWLLGIAWERPATSNNKKQTTSYNKDKQGYGQMRGKDLGWIHWFTYPVPQGGHLNTDYWPDT
jgi:hypothetical protein